MYIYYGVILLNEVNMEFNLEKIQARISKIDDLVNDSSLEDALELNIRTYEEALANDHIELIANCLYYFGAIENIKAEPQKAMAFFKKATILARKHNLDVCLAKVLNLRGNLYVVSGQLHVAIEKYLEALSLIETNPLAKNLKERILNNLGILYLEVDDYNQAIKYLFECVHSAKNDDNKLLLTTAYSNLTEVYIKQKAYLKAKYYNRLSEQLSLKIGDNIGIALAIANGAVICNEDKHQWDKASLLFHEALGQLEATEEVVDKDEILLKYGTQAYYADEYSLAEEILGELANAAHAKTYYKIELNALKILEKVYEHNKEYAKGFHIIKRHLEIVEKSYQQWKYKSIEKIDKNIGESIGFSQVNDLQKSIKTLKLLSEIGQKITACTTDAEIYTILVEDAAKVFSCDAFGVGIKAKNNISIDYKFHDKGLLTEIEISIFETEYLMSNCIKVGKDIIIYDTNDDKYNKANYEGRLLQIISESDYDTIMFCPIKFEKKTIGGITIQNEDKGKLTYVDLESLRVLASYLAIAYTNLQRSQELVIANKKLEQVSLLDGLTGVYNRHALGQYIGREFIGMLEHKLPATTLMIDIDYFKQYNDHYGHVMGDKCLKKVCASLRKSLANYKHRLFRYGGDEFFVVIEGCGVEKSKVLLNKIMHEMKILNIEHLSSKIEDRVTLTIGACVIEYAITDYTIVFTSADEALYVAKDGGRNNYEINVLVNSEKVSSNA